ncbi:MAG: imidazolonepropionase [Actinomycetota bacterium]
MSELVVRNIGRLVTCDGGPENPLGVMLDAAVRISGGVVSWIGASRDASFEGAEEIDAHGACVLPGLVDCHTHLIFAGDRSEEFVARMSGKPYEASGVRFTKAATRAASNDELSALARKRLDRFLSFGVTTVEAKSGYGLNTEQEIRLLEIASRLDHTVEVVRTFMGAHVVPSEYEDDPDVYVALVCDEMIPQLRNLAEFCDVWIDEGAFTAAQAHTILRAARVAGMSLKVHAEQLTRSGGSIVAAEFGAISADHLEHATLEDARALARSGTIAVLLPGASMMTRSKFADARMLIDVGVPVAISTDFNAGSSYSENLPLAASLACAHLGMTVEEAIIGVTRHAAAALSRSKTHGLIAPGARGDLLILDASHESELVYHYGASSIRSVIKDGRVVH